MDNEQPIVEVPQAYAESQAEARSLAESVSGIAAKADETDDIDPQMHAALADSGPVVIQVPGAYRGRFHGTGSLAVTVVREALTAERAHLDSTLGMQGIGSYAISAGATEAVGKRGARPTRIYEGSTEVILDSQAKQLVKRLR